MGVSAPCAEGEKLLASQMMVKRLSCSILSPIVLVLGDSKALEPVGHFDVNGFPASNPKRTKVLKWVFWEFR
jgi:hypothetical protein